MNGFIYKILKQFKGEFRLLLWMTVMFTAGVAGLAFLIKSAGEMSAADISNVTTMELCSVILSFITLSTLYMSVFKVDEKTAWTNFALSVPKGMKKLLSQKYIFILILYTASLLYWLLIDRAAINILDGNKKASTTTLLSVYAFELIVAAVTIPFLVRFGTKIGAAIKTAIVTILMAVVVIYVLFGDISFFMKKNVFVRILEFLSRDDLYVYVIIFTVSAIVLFGISYLISLKLYRKGASELGMS